MERSDELKNVLLRAYDALNRNDPDELAARFSARFLAIGTDATEWWTEHPVWEAVLRAQAAELGSWRWVAGDVHPWSEGTVGWVADRPVVELADRSIPTRVTAVLHLERGDWRIVQWHLSIGIANEEA